MLVGFTRQFTQLACDNATAVGLLLASGLKVTKFNLSSTVMLLSLIAKTIMNSELDNLSSKDSFGCIFG